MRAKVWVGMCLALTASWTVVGLGQGSQTTEQASATRIAMVGCIAQPEPSRSGTSGTTGSPATANGAMFMLTNAAPGTAVTAGTTTVKTAANQIKTAAAGRYRLDGSDSMLAPYVAHRVEITGTIEQPTASQRPVGAAANAPTLTVDSVRMLAATCS